MALARALAPAPRLLLLDEPLSALDLKLRRGMQVELKRIQRETGITFVLVTHDQEEALSMSDRIAVMDQGRVLQLGAPADIYERPNCALRGRFHRRGQCSAGRAGRALDAPFAAIRPERVSVATRRRRRPRPAGPRRRAHLSRRDDRLRRSTSTTGTTIKVERNDLPPRAGAAARPSPACSRRRAAAAGELSRAPRSPAGATARCCWPGPALLTIIVFMLLPMGIALVYSFLTPSPYGGVQHPFTAASYVRFVYDRDLDDTLVFDTTYLQIFARSLVQAALATVLCFLIGLPLAWYMATRPPRLRQLLVLLVTIPFWTNLLIRTYCWVLLLRDQGLVNEALQALGPHSRADHLPLFRRRGPARPRLFEPALHGAADLRRARKGRSAHDRGGLRPLCRPLGHHAQARLAAGEARASRPASCWSSCPRSAPSSRPTSSGGGKKLMIGSLIQQQFTTGRDWSFGAALSMILMAFVLGSLMWNACAGAADRRALA